MTKKINQELRRLYDRLDNLGDLRDRGYPVPVSDISSVKEKIRMLEGLRD
jgi:hypothetical protein